MKIVGSELELSEIEFQDIGPGEVFQPLERQLHEYYFLKLNNGEVQNCWNLNLNKYWTCSLLEFVKIKEVKLVVTKE